MESCDNHAGLQWSQVILFQEGGRNARRATAVSERGKRGRWRREREEREREEREGRERGRGKREREREKDVVNATFHSHKGRGKREGRGVGCVTIGGSGLGTQGADMEEGLAEKKRET